MTMFKHDKIFEEAQSVAFKASKAELNQYVERMERLQEEGKHLTAQKREVLAEAKGRGFDVKALRRVLAERKKDKDVREEENATFSFYADILGL